MPSTFRLPKQICNNIISLQPFQISTNMTNLRLTPGYTSARGWPLQQDVFPMRSSQQQYYHHTHHTHTYRSQAQIQALLRDHACTEREPVQPSPMVTTPHRAVKRPVIALMSAPSRLCGVVWPVSDPVSSNMLILKDWWKNGEVSSPTSIESMLGLISEYGGNA